jgi:hypothetical protein
MIFRSQRQKFAADKSGAAAVEFAFITLSLLLFTFAIFDVGFALYWFNRAEKATQLGVRIAAVSDPVSDFFEDFSGVGGASPPAAGQPCEEPDGTVAAFCNHAVITCTVDGTTGTCTATGAKLDDEPGNFVRASFEKIFNEMRVVYPQLSSEDVEVEYRPSVAGFAGRPGNVAGKYNLVPQVTVRIVGLEYNYIALGALLGLESFTLPDISASINGEDLNHTTDL